MSWAADHITPVSAGGAIDGPLQAVHKVCNERKRANPKHLQTSKDWYG